MKKYICFDIGGTTIKYGLLEENGNILFKGEVDTEARTKGGRNICKKIVDISNEYKKDYQLSGVCISSSGMIDPIKGVILFADEHLIPGYTGLEMKEIVERETNLPCSIENDVNCAGLGELWKGIGENNAKYVSMITVGTGIGSCLIEDGKLINGGSMCAGEIGKIQIPGGKFEDISSTYATTSMLEKKLGKKEGEISGRDLFEMYESNNPDAIEALENMTTNLAIGISTMCFIYNPEIIILGGGIMAREEYFKPAILSKLKKLLPDVIFDNTKLEFAKLKNDAGIVGALRHFLNTH